ncbi:MAG: alanine--tRNA ligase [Deltaproteobacteria bacterium]|jgi:alanyl-tRNA synthetase|nr:alanine--tRNA ligase [Deltaproteobacteria bacterium]
MLSTDIRNTFLGFFERNGHRRMASSPLVPEDDPTLLFTNAGMVQFKRIFTGEAPSRFRRATTSQKCVRAGGKHNDLENVGYTARHHTFFEMLGNFSFGDYFKQDAVRFAWELLTDVFRLPADRLYATVYLDDDEAFGLWQSEAGVPAERIVRLGEKDNFWAMGDTGPCGPCSEILIDQGPELGCGRPECAPGCDCDRYLEIWNLVFMQFERSREGVLTPLPKPSIDTGLGLERLAAVTQGVISNFESDVFRPLLERVSDLSGVPYVYGRLMTPDDPAYQTNVSLRVIADHARAAAFLLADGVRPENLGRGYVLRRILRRAVRHGRKLGLLRPFLGHMTEAVIAKMSDAYPELAQGASYIRAMASGEEERFRETLEGGMKALTDAMGEIRARGGDTLPGSLVFKLYDTYGFPADLTADAARENGLAIDEGGFGEAMEAQKAKGRAAWKGRAEAGALLDIVNQLAARGFSTEFLGYGTLEATAVPALIIREGADPGEGAPPPGGEAAGDAREVAEASGAGSRITLVFARTPFYAASGGQESDTGTIAFPGGRVRVEEVAKAPGSGIFLHRCVIEEGTVARAEASLRVDPERRARTACSHSATHLLHRALRLVLGDHVRQAGSSVSAGRLRFDFTHGAPLSPEEARRVELAVNSDIRSDFPVETEILPMEEAVRTGAMALFEEKYGDTVRVVSMGGSRELCGGTHTTRTGTIGLFLVASEGAVSSGVRRVECLTGEDALRLLHSERDILGQLSGQLKAPPAEIPERVAKLGRRVRELEKAAASPQQGAAADIAAVCGGAEEVGGVRFLAAKVPAASPRELRETGDLIRERLGSSFVLALAAESGGKAILLAAVGRDLQGRFKAGDVVSRMAVPVGGKGGGRPDLAQAGGPGADRLEEALAAARAFVSGQG